MSWNWFSQHFHLGDVPTWFAAVGAWVAAAFAFGQLRAVRQELSHVKQTQDQQLELLDLEIKDRRATQARQVVVQRDVGPSPLPGGAGQNGYAPVLIVDNHSTGTISDLRAWFEIDGGGRHEALHGPTRDTMGPGPIERLDAHQATHLWGPTYSREIASTGRGELHFTDDSRRRWRIDHTGQLSELDQP